jgi:hypothetical protein
MKVSSYITFCMDVTPNSLQLRENHGLSVFHKKSQGEYTCIKGNKLEKFAAVEWLLAG